jgi:transposase
LAPPPGGSPAREGAEALSILRAWIDALRDAPSWEALLAPTPARGRSLRNLTVNVFHPFELLPTAWSGEFPWHPENDGNREQRLERLEDLLAFAVGAADGWRSFLENEHLAGGDRVVESPRGQMRFSALVSFQRWHAAYHYRQLVHVLGRERPDLAAVDDLVLPREVF